MYNEKVNFLKTYLILCIDHDQVLEAEKTGNSPYVLLGVRNTPAFIKKD